MIHQKLIKKSISKLAASALLVSTVGLVSSCSSTGKSSGQIDFNAKKYVLDNGLTVIIATNPKLPTVSYYTLFDVGGRDETKGTTGATHFLEHMMFKGAKKYGPGQFDTGIEKSGGNTNAYTTSDMTVYYQNIPATFLPTMIDMEADRMQNLLLEKYSFEAERNVIFEERKMRYENSPDGLLYLTLTKKAFAGTPYGQSVIGEVEDLKALTREQMMTFFKNYYVPNNAIVGIVGDVNTEEVLKIVKEKYGVIPKSNELAALKQKTSSPDMFKSQAEWGKNYQIYSSTSTPKFGMAFKSTKIGERKSYVLDLMAMILGNGASSYLNQKYVKSDNPLLTSISLYNHNMIHDGILFFNGDISDGKTPEEAQAQLTKDFSLMCGEALTKESLQRAKNQLEMYLYSGFKTNAGVASGLIKNEKYYGDFNYTQKEMEIYESISLSEIKTACKSTLLESKPIFVATWDKYSKSSEAK